jgi:hypothetical protein
VPITKTVRVPQSPLNQATVPATNSQDHNLQSITEIITTTPPNPAPPSLEAVAGFVLLSPRLRCKFKNPATASPSPIEPVLDPSFSAHHCSPSTVAAPPHLLCRAAFIVKPRRHLKPSTLRFSPNCRSKAQLCHATVDLT